MEQNYRCRLGEVDLIMGEGKVLVFVEVRYRRNANFGGGIESVDQRKQCRLASVASHFLQRFPQWSTAACRFDVVAISGAGSPTDIDWIAHAFEDPRR